MEFREERLDDLGLGVDLTAIEAGILTGVLLSLCCSAWLLYLYMHRLPQAIIGSRPMCSCWRAAGVLLTAAAVNRLCFLHRTGCGALVDLPSPAQSVLELQAQAFEQDPGLFYKYKRAGIPVVVRGMLREEAASGFWHPAALGQELQGFKVNVALGNVEQQEHGSQLEMDFEDFSAMVLDSSLAASMEQGDGVPYLAEVTDQWAKSDRMRLRAESIVNTSLGWASPFVTSMMFWMGPKHTLTGLHADTEAMNVLHQLHGSKTVWMFTPGMTRYLYQSPKYDNGATNFLVDPFKPDLIKFPDYALASAVNVTIGPGDALFVPFGWPHFVRSESASVSLSGRSYSSCEVAAHVPTITFSIMHRLGLYKDQQQCACHISSRKLSNQSLT